MSNLKAEMIFTAKTDGLTKEVKKSVKSLSGLGKGSLKTSKQIGVITKSSDKTVKSFKGLAKNSKLTQKSFKNLSKVKLAKTLKKTGDASKKTGRAFKGASRDGNGFKRSQDGLNRSLKSANNGLRSQTELVKKLGRAHRNVKTDALRGGGFVGVGTKGVGKPTANNLPEKTKQPRRGGGVVAGGGKKLLAGLVTFGAASIGKRIFDSVVGSIREIDVGKGALKSLGMTDTSFVVDMGKELQAEYAGIYAADFTKAAYDIKSGISTLSNQGVAEVTKAAALTAKATLGDLSNMTSLFATAHKMFKDSQYAELSDGTFANMFASIISTAVKENKTDGAKMQTSIESAGDYILSMGMPMEELIATLGVLQGTKQAGVAGTNLKAFGENLYNAQEKINKLAGSKKSNNKQGVTFFNEQGLMLPIETIMNSIQERYKETSPDKMGAELKGAFGSSEAVGFIMALLKNAGEITRQAKNYKEVAKTGIKVTEDMAGSHDEGSIDAAKKKTAQAKDLNAINAAEANRETILKKEKAAADAYINSANIIADKNATFTDSESSTALFKAFMTDTFGYLGLAIDEVVAKYKESGDLTGSFNLALSKSIETIYAHRGAFETLVTVVGALTAVGGVKMLAKSVKNRVTGQYGLDKAARAEMKAEKKAMREQLKTKRQVKKTIPRTQSITQTRNQFKAEQNFRKPIAANQNAPIRNVPKTITRSLPKANSMRGVGMGGLASVLMGARVNREANYQNQMHGERMRLAQDKFKTIGVDATNKQAFATMQAYKTGALDRSQLDSLIERMKAAIPVEKFEQLLANYSQSSTAISQQYGIANIPMNAPQPVPVEENDNRQDNRKYDQRVSVTNHIVVNVKTQASGQAIGQAVATKLKTMKHPSPVKAEMLFDGDY